MSLFPLSFFLFNKFRCDLFVDSTILELHNGHFLVYAIELCGSNRLFARFNYIY